MKTKIITTCLALAFCRSLLAGDSGNPSRAFRPAQGPEPVERASTLLLEKTVAACCAVEEKPAVKDACCAAMPASAFSKDSLFQADATFTDDGGRPFTLGSLRGRPVVLTMFFATCGYACPLLVTDLQAIRGRLRADQRDRAVFVLVSFDTARDTPQALAKYRELRGLDAAWVLLHGGDGAVRELAALLGVKYKQEADGMFSHSNLITVLNAEGEIIHQRSGLKGGLEETAQAVARAGP